MTKKISYERRVYESVDDNNLSKAISQKTDEKNKSCNRGLIINLILCLWSTKDFFVGFASCLRHHDIQALEIRVFSNYVCKLTPNSDT